MAAVASKASQTMDKEDDSEWKTNDWCKEIHSFLPLNTWIINKNFFLEKQAHEEIIGDFDARRLRIES